MDALAVNPLALPFVLLEQRSQLPATPAIYFAINAIGTIQYIGRSTNLQERWINHHRYSQLFDMGNVKIAWLDVSEPSLLPEIEKALIDWFQPRLNGSVCQLDGKPRITISLPPDVHQELSERASREGRSTSNLAAFLLTLAIRGEEPAKNKAKNDKTGQD